MKKNRHTLSIIFLATLTHMFFTPATVTGSNSKTTNIIPIPVSIEHRDGFFIFRPSIRIIAEDKAETEASKLIDALAPAMGYRLKLAPKARPKARVVKLEIDERLSQLGDEGYMLDVSAKQILIRVRRPTGLFYGIQTLLQLLPAPIFSKAEVRGIKWKLPCLKITDYPRFQWRGLLIDPARHFIPVNDVKKFLDIMAMHKFNRLQMHLTDNIGWRIEIKNYPNLTKLASNRDRSGGNGGFYSQEEIRELVQYAQKRHITIVPEIEMPYHAGAAINAYPHLGINPARVEGMPLDKRWAVLGGLSAPRPETVEFMQNVLAEVIELFDSRFIHIGGDEANLKLWENDPEMQTQMKKLGCKNAHELHSWFIKQMDAFLTDNNRRLLGWDEILQGGLAPGATVMSWRGIQGGITAARAGHDVVMAPTSHTYFDYRQAPSEKGLSRNVINLEKVYSFEPLPAELSNKQARHILGGQAQLWGELIPDQNRREFMAYPRACALIETVWSPKQLKNYENFIARLRHHLERLDVMGINYRQLD
ncbi:MAG: beta-N-acetylhexosaminidase [Planctomycetes bacterium]|nr:beta-N-acetylhexosaminidase [Planctomycetota bacterium]